MSDDIELIREEGKEQMDHTLDHLAKELKKIRTGKASGSMLDGILVQYYGNPTPLNQVGNISTSDSRTLVIQPWEKSIIGDIEQAIFKANLGVTPQNDGEVIRIIIPPLTADRRKQLVKQAEALGEDAKVSLRSARHKMLDVIKKEVKNGFPEDAGKRQEDDVQKVTNAYGQKVDDMIEAKEKDIMTI